MSDFFRPIYSNVNHSCAREGEKFAFLRESINIFDFGQNSFEILPNSIDNKLVFVERAGSQQSLSEIIFRIVKIATLIIPLVKLGGAAIYYLANDFQLQAPTLESVRQEIPKTTDFDSLTEDLMKLLFKHLGPICFQLASTHKRAFTIMSEDLSLGKYRMGREILKQCFSSKFMSYMESEEKIRATFIKSLAAYDLAAAFKRANSQQDLKCRVYDLVVVSEFCAEFDKIKSLEILEHAYNEIHSVGQSTKSFFRAILKGRVLSVDKLAALTRLIKGFLKNLDFEKVNKISQEILQGGLPSIADDKDAEIVLWEFNSLNFLKCRKAKILTMEDSDIGLNIRRIAYLFPILPQEANLLVEDVIECLNHFIDHVPNAEDEYIFLLFELARVLVNFKGQKACELAERAMIKAKTTPYFCESHIKYVEILLKCGQIDPNQAIGQTLKIINAEKQNDYSKYISNLLIFSETISSFDKKLGEELAKECFEVVQKDIVRRKMRNIREVVRAVKASVIIAPYDQKKTFEMLDQVSKHEVLSAIAFFNDEDARPILLSYRNAFKAVAKVDPQYAKEVAESLKNSLLRLSALTGVVKGIIK